MTDDKRDLILDAALKIAPFEGWTSLTLKRAVRDVGLPDGAEGLYFEKGVASLLDHWAAKMDVQTEAAIGEMDLASLKIRERVTQGVLARLEALGPHEEAARRASSRLILPDMAGTGLQQIWRAADTIWTAIGDTSTDANYYSKRTILSGVIGATLPVWLSDNDPDKTKARAFLDARIENVMGFEKLKWQVKSATKDFPNPAEILGQLRYGGLDMFTRPKKGRARRRRYSR
ncbi:COQ9 family protein [Litorimonas sp. WD9-15]|uniref:COQ9 family protein n=1 Tax=Litorimonas sp. WD9-15 TaxID=3418716 RepID=UPI003D093979